MREYLDIINAIEGNEESWLSEAIHKSWLQDFESEWVLSQ